MRIGWENIHGGYYVKKLLAEIKTQEENVGDISELTTTDKTDIVSAINELVERVTALENPTTEEGEL